jgi:tetratricopeptide (TPR) repeat protein
MPHLLRARSAVEPQALRALGKTLSNLGRFDEAAEIFARIPRLAPDELALCRRLARAEAGLRGGEAAPGVAAVPDVAALLELGTALFAARQYDRAASALVEALRLDPTQAPALALLCEMQVRAKLRVVREILTPRSVRWRGVDGSARRRGG